MITHAGIGNSGRFGNQIFQLAALIGIAEKNGYDIKIPIENTGNPFTFFDLAKQAAEPTGMELRNAFNLPNKYFAPFSEISAVVDKRYQEPFFHFNNIALDIPDNTDISGFFQSEKYFKHAEVKVRQVLTFRPEIRQLAEHQLAEVKDDAPRVSIHVRRGDYVANSANHTVTGMEYYAEAINKFFSKEPYRFVVFSDDPEWCKQMFDGGHIVDINNSYVEMCMMSMCDHHIIANSSFSWWGAWLNPNPKKIVTAPSQWFGPNLRHNSVMDLLPNEWFWI